MPILTLFFLVHAIPPTPTVSPDPDVVLAREVSTKLKDAQTAHLWRVTGWGAGNVAAGSAMMATAALAGDGGRYNEPFFADPGLFGVGAQAAGWGAINLGIVAVGALFLPDVIDERAEAEAAEGTWRAILLVNEGLNVGYVAMGAAIFGAGFLPLPYAHLLQGHGLGIMLQGMGLFLFDGLAILEAYKRKANLDPSKEHREPEL